MHLPTVHCGIFGLSYFEWQLLICQHTHFDKVCVPKLYNNIKIKHLLLGPWLCSLYKKYA